MKRRSIHRFWAVIFVLIAVEAAIGLAVWQWPRLFPSHYVSEVYRSYADQPGIDATFLRDFPVNDTVTVKVTLFQAETDSAWAALMKKFNIPPIPEEVQKSWGQNLNAVTFRSVSKEDFSLLSDGGTQDYLLFVQQERQHRLAVFEIEQEIQHRMILHYIVSELSTPKQ